MAHRRVLAGRSAVQVKFFGQIDEFGQMAVDGQLVADSGPLVHQGGDQHLPALVLGADQVRAGHAHIFKKDLVELGVAGHLHQRPQAEAGRLHIDHQTADALVLGGVRIGAHKQLDVVGAVGKAGPDFLAVDHKIVALFNSSGLH